jgi:hypothetical protein
MSKEFPFKENYLDYSGNEITFIIENATSLVAGYLVKATEVGKDYGYEFEAYSPVSPYLAAGDIRGKIKKGLATCYMQEYQGSLAFTHQMIEGRITHQGLVVNGEHVLFDDFAKMLTTFEGFNVKIELVEPDA